MRDVRFAIGPRELVYLQISICTVSVRDSSISIVEKNVPRRVNHPVTETKFRTFSLSLSSSSLSSDDIFLPSLGRSALNFCAVKLLSSHAADFQLLGFF